MKIKSTISSSGKKNRPEKIDKNEEEKISADQITQTSEVQPGEQESKIIIPQKTKSQEKISTVQDTQTSNVQPGAQESRMHIPQKTKSQSESSSSEESIYYSCEDTDDSDDDVSLTKEQKCRFFQILKGLLEDPGSLKNGKERKVRHNGKIFKLMYMTKRCEIIIRDLHGHLQFKEVVSTRDIYLKWHGKKAEPLSMENLQKVQNELRFLQILNEKADACFYKAIKELMREFEFVQKNTTLQLICDDIILTFVSGEGKNVATVVYDNCNHKPKYEMKVIWWISFLRFLRSMWLKICEWSDNLSNLCNAYTSFLNSIIDWYRSWQKHQKMQ